MVANNSFNAKYDNGTKQTWRGWAWNQIASRTKKNDLVMVLCGDSAADVPHAKKRDLRCVGVDIVEENVAKFRKAGGVAVHGKLHTTAFSMKPNAIIADMLGGLTERSAQTPLTLSHFCDAFVWNGLRGRDPIGGELSSISSGLPIPSFRNGRMRFEEVGKHRGKILYAGIISSFWHVYEHGVAPSDDDFDGTAAIPDWFIRQVAKVHKPVFYSYRSKDGGQYFDSMAISGHKKQKLWPELASNNRTSKAKRRSAAAKAILTMRHGKA